MDASTVKNQNVTSIDKKVLSLVPNAPFPRYYALVIPNKPVIRYFVYSTSRRDLPLHAVVRDAQIIEGETYLSPEPAEQKLLEIARKELRDLSSELSLPYHDLTQEIF
jgi:hypothetical protein